MGVYVLKVLELPEGPAEHRLELTVPWLKGQLEGVEGIGAGEEGGVAELTTTRRGREVLIRGTVSSPLMVTCVRCLEDSRQEVSAELDVLMLPERQGAGGAEDSDELGVERYSGDTIVLDELLRDTILLEVPMNPNCGDGCPGWAGLTDNEAAKERGQLN